MVYQNEHIPQIFYVKMQKVKIKAVLQESFWTGCPAQLEKLGKSVFFKI